MPPEVGGLEKWCVRDLAPERTGRPRTGSTEVAGQHDALLATRQVTGEVMYPFLEVSRSIVGLSLVFYGAVTEHHVCLLVGSELVRQSIAATHRRSRV